MTDSAADIVLDCDGIPVQARYHPGTGQELVILFHGSVNRKERPIPVYYTPFDNLGTAHQISIFDPTLARYKKLTSCWYLGWQDTPLWDRLSAAIIAFSKQKGCTHRTYVGGSSGGFAALLYGHLDQGSTAVAVNAQTNVLRHVYGRVSRNYLETAWPKLSREEWPEVLPLKLGPIVAKNTNSTIIYLQSSSDYLHLANHALPFLNALPPESFDRHVVNIDFDGTHGHGASIQRPTIRQWILASFVARSVTENPYAAIVEAKHDMDLSNASHATHKTKEKSGFRLSDLHIADRLAQWHISKGPVS